jgi:dipeptidyl-peptidase 4
MSTLTSSAPLPLPRTGAPAKVVSRLDSGRAPTAMSTSGHANQGRGGSAVPRSGLMAILAAALVLSAAPAAAQERGGAPNANWPLAERFNSENVSRFVHSTAVPPNWIAETDSLWYSWQDATGTRFQLVVPRGPTKRPLFDHQRMAELLSQELRRPVEAHDLPIEDLEFAEDGVRIEFVAKDTRFEYHLDRGTLRNLGEVEEEEDEREWRRFSPDSTAYVFAEDHNLYLVEIVGGLEQEPIQLTTDGEEDYSFGQRRARNDREANGARVRPGVDWSEDSQAFHVSRTDWRGLDTDLWVINYTADPRPRLNSYRKVMGGEDTGYRELHVYRRGDTTLTELPMVHRWKDQSNVNIHFGATTNQLRLVRRDRLWQNLDLIEVDLNTLEVRTLVSESLAWSTLEGGAGFGNMYQPHYLGTGDDFLWWSERTGWGHFYLYDHNGNLKRPVTEGAWRADNLVAIDSVARVAWIQGMGREAGENPYHQHLYRVEVDRSRITLLDAGDYFHRSSLSPSKRLVLSSYSRPDTPWRSVLRDHRGNVVLELEAMDVSALAEMGWRPPQMFVVKAADGITDIYGNMFKPFDFDPTRRYPIIASVYPGPQSEGVSSTFSASAAQQRLAQLGFIVVQLGNRGGSPKRSAAYRAHGYQNLRDYGLADKKAGIEELAIRHPYMDITRVGIFGHSGGGFMTAAALLVPPYNDFFTVGVASNGNHDNNVYSDYWAEQNHGLQFECVERRETVAENGSNGEDDELAALRARRAIPGDGYCDPDKEVKWKIDVPSNSSMAENLKGKLMLAFSDMDNNVHPANTVRLVKALVEADKRFDLVMLPGRAHGFGPMSGYFGRLRDEFFAEHLLGDYYRDQVDIRRD